MVLTMLTFETPIPAQFADTLGSQSSCPDQENCGAGVAVGGALVAVGRRVGTLVGGRRVGVGVGTGVSVAVGVNVGVAV